MFVRLERQSFELGICLTVNSMQPFSNVLDLELCYDVVAESLKIQYGRIIFPEECQFVKTG